MNTSDYLQSRKIFFKQWKRTSWAVFASLKMVVHNCCTNISSFKDSLMKQQGADRSELVKLSIDIDSLLESDYIESLWKEKFLLTCLFLKMTPFKLMKEVSMMLLSSYYISLLTNSKKSVGIFYTSII